MTEHKHLAPTTDGYGEITQDQRPGDFVRFLDGSYFKADLPLATDYRPVAYAVAHTRTHWKDRQKVDEIKDPPLPDLDELNASVPKDQWEIGLDGNLRPPWSDCHKVYLVDTTTGERAIFETSSIGGRIAWSRLVDKVQWIRRIRGESVVPRVQLGVAPMKTRFGIKKRPDFQIVEWLDSSSGTPLPASDTPQLAKVSEPTIAEDINDKIAY